MTLPSGRDRMPPAPRQPLLNLPPTVIALIAINVAVQLVVSVMPRDALAWTLINLGFVPLRYSAEGAGGWPAWVAPITYQFLHGGWLHLAINMVMLAAFGAALERAAGRGRLLVLYLVSGVAGAFLHFALFPTATTPVVGASGSISGLFGAVLWLMARPDRFGRRAMRFWPAALVWVGLSVVVGFIGLPGVAGQIAWAAHVGGFVVGIVLTVVMVARAQTGPPRR